MSRKLRLGQKNGFLTKTNVYFTRSTTAALQYCCRPLRSITQILFLGHHYAEPIKKASLELI